jgi:hypothetical protein
MPVGVRIERKKGIYSFHLKFTSPPRANAVGAYSAQSGGGGLCEKFMAVWAANPEKALTKLL